METLSPFLDIRIWSFFSFLDLAFFFVFSNQRIYFAFQILSGLCEPVYNYKSIVDLFTGKENLVDLFDGKKNSVDLFAKFFDLKVLAFF